MVSNKLFSKPIIALTLIMVSLFSAMQTQATTSFNSRSMWKVIAPQGSGFSVRMPGQPVKKIDGRITQYTYKEQTGSRTFFYGLSHQDYNSIPANLEEALRAECRGFAKGFEGDIVKWMPITKNGYKGIAARVESSNATSLVAAWYVGSRAYCIAFATQKIDVLPEEASAFINSLSLIG